jgi:hypothetical protein
MLDANGRPTVPEQQLYDAARADPVANSTRRRFPDNHHKALPTGQLKEQVAQTKEMTAGRW